MNELLSQAGDIGELFRRAQMEPLCGWPWLEAQYGKVYPEQRMTVRYGGKVLLDIKESARRGLIKAAMEGVDKG